MSISISRTIAGVFTLLCLLCPGSARAEEEEAQSSLPEAEDVADVPAVDLVVKGDEKKRYALIGLDEKQKPPKGGYGLILILPGGSGSIDFHPFIKRIHKHAVPKGYVTAQLVAPVWNSKQAEKLVWPIERHTVNDAKFTTEEFISDVVKEISKQTKIDSSRVFTLTWSSSGPAGYAMSVTKKTPVTGTFVAMSVFKPDQMPSLSAAKGRAYYILHSPEDRIPIRFAEEARDSLKKKKAKVEFKTYEGGHGWHGDVYGNIRGGIEWLERNRKKR